MMVVLPAGSPVTPDKVIVQTTVGTATVAASGQVAVSVYKDSPQIALVLNSSGTPMLMGWVDALHNQISASTTAEVLAYYALGGFLTLNDSDRTLMEQTIASNNGLPALTTTISSEIVANPDAFAQPNAPLTAALNTFYKAVTGVTPRKHGVVVPMGIVITPGAQSGLNVIQQPPSQAYLTNSYRRRTHAFVTRVKNTKVGPPNVDTPDPADITDFEVPPTVGVNGGVTGSLTDIFGTYFGNQPTAYAPIDTSATPFSVPLKDGFDRTTYQVTVVGPGISNVSAFSNLTPTMITARTQVSVAGFVSDAFVPFLTNFAFGSGFLPSAGRSASSSVSAFQAALINNIEVDLLGFIPTVPGLMDKITAGDWGGALSDMFATTANSNTVRTIFVNAVKNAVITSQLATNLDIGPFVGAAKSFDTILNAAGGVLQVFDSGVYVAQVAGADAADQWTVTVDATKVTLSPAMSTIKQTETVSLTAAAPGVDTTGWSYQWIVSGSAGTLSEVGGGGRTNQSSFCSSSAKVTYVPNASPTLTASATDTISVEAFSGGNCNTSAGKPATASVTVTPVTIDYTLYGGPGAVNCTPNAPAPSTLFENDDLYVYLNGKLNFTHIGATCDMGPIKLTGAKKGDTVEIKVYDTYGSGTGLSALYMNDGTGKYVMVDPGFYNPNTPPGNNGLQYDHSFTIPF